MQDFLSAMQRRRSYYHLGEHTAVGKKRIVELVGQALLYTPSAFNMQSARAALLFGADHKRFWSVVSESLKGIVPANRFPQTEQKISFLASGLGTVLFFEDLDVIREYGERFAPYKERMAAFAYEGNAMLQFAVWNLLEQEGLGVSLHHYNPLVDQAVRREWDIPLNWELNAQMPFGEIKAGPDEKETAALEERMKVF